MILFCKTAERVRFPVSVVSLFCGSNLLSASRLVAFVEIKVSWLIKTASIYCSYPILVTADAEVLWPESHDQSEPLMSFVCCS